jgi:hypothetical protein
MADGYLLPFIGFPFNFDSLHITFALPSNTFSPVDLLCNRHLNFPIGFYADTKKPAKKSFRVLAGISYKPKKLCAT